ncbi:MAG: DUF1598 domain-containing protein [Pirellulales bacterium]
MSIRNRTTTQARRFVLATALAAASLYGLQPAQAQFVNQQVGGVSIDARGVLSKIRVDELDQLKHHRQAAFMAVPGELKDAGLRKVSLRELEAAIEEHQKNGTPISDDIRYLAGLQRIQYVFVYPETRDIVIAGPAEGWKLNALGDVVGETTNRPVLLLDDLLVALRSIEGAQQTGISCSIDPTEDGLARSAALTRKLRNPGANIKPLLAELEQAMGPQTITVKGVPDTSHFARVLVAADYRMKRIAMGFEESPVAGLPNYLQMIKTTGRAPKSMLPRWWLEPNYDAILADADGMAFEFRGAGVKALTQDEVATASGQKQATGKSDPRAQKWAELMTAHYDELSTKDPIFGQLRNCIDMAVLAALIHKENLAEKAGWSMALLVSSELPVESYHAPRQVDSQGSAVAKGGAWVLSVSGGVLINPWQPLAEPQQSLELGADRTKAATRGTGWWWN